MANAWLETLIDVIELLPKDIIKREVCIELKLWNFLKKTILSTLRLYSSWNCSLLLRTYLVLTEHFQCKLSSKYQFPCQTLFLSYTLAGHFVWRARTLADIWKICQTCSMTLASFVQPGSSSDEDRWEFNLKWSILVHHIMSIDSILFSSVSTCRNSINVLCHVADPWYCYRQRSVVTVSPVKAFLLSHSRQSSNQIWTLFVSTQDYKLKKK